jgi:hypothetical protein
MAKLKVIEEFSERASERVEKTADIVPARFRTPRIATA